MSVVNPAGGSGTDEGRDSWCTPEWLADLLNTVAWDLDPCSNYRSHVQAQRACCLEDGENGLLSEEPGHFSWAMSTLVALATWLVFCNPPYARGAVIRWVRHYRHTRFCFLLRWDPSTEWFAELLPHTTHVWFPNRRINFEPPPGVKSSSNPFPHALYLRDPPVELLNALAPHGYTLDTALARAQSATHERTTRDETGAAGGGSRGAAAGGEGGARDDDRSYCFWCGNLPLPGWHDEDCEALRP